MSILNLRPTRGFSETLGMRDTGGLLPGVHADSRVPKDWFFAPDLWQQIGESAAWRELCHNHPADALRALSDAGTSDGSPLPGGIARPDAGEKIRFLLARHLGRVMTPRSPSGDIPVANAASALVKPTREDVSNADTVALRHCNIVVANFAAHLWGGWGQEPLALVVSLAPFVEALPHPELGADILRLFPSRPDRGYVAKW